MIMLFLKYWKLAAAAILALLIIGGWLYVSHLRGSVERLEGELAVSAATLEQQQQVNADNLAALARMQEEHAAAVAALATERAIAKERTKTVNRLKERITNVKPENDGAVALVLRDALAGLREAGSAARENTGRAR